MQGATTPPNQAKSRVVSFLFAAACRGERHAGGEQNQAPLGSGMQGGGPAREGVGPWWRLAGGRTSAPGGTTSVAAFRAKDGAPGSNEGRMEVRWRSRRWWRRARGGAVRGGGSSAVGPIPTFFWCAQQGPWSVSYREGKGASTRKRKAPPGRTLVVQSDPSRVNAVLMKMIDEFLNIKMIAYSFSFFTRLTLAYAW
jgi:hypothetical protein